MNKFIRENHVLILTVFSIITLFGLFSIFSINNARSIQRDAVRLSQIRQIQSGLEDYMNLLNVYPSGKNFVLGDKARSFCLSNEGFSGDCALAEKTILKYVPFVVSDGLKHLVVCGEPLQEGYCYTNTKEDLTSYVIQFELENNWPQMKLQKGLVCAISGNMISGVCPKE